MSNHRDKLILSAASQLALPQDFVEALRSECPWLDGAEEVNESFGPELLSEQAARLQVSREQVERFLYAYNAQIRALEQPFESLRAEAYAEICAALVGQGRADSFGEGDYWVNSQSFRTREPTIVVYNGFFFSSGSVRTLQRILSSYASSFSELRVSSEEGTEVITLHPQ